MDGTRKRSRKRSRSRSRSGSNGSRSSGNKLKRSKVDKNPLLINACFHKNNGLVAQYLSEGANVNYIDPNTGYTPLLIAAETGNYEVVQLLISNHAIVDTWPESFVIKPITTPIILANKEDHSNVVTLLEENGAVLPETKQEKPANFNLVLTDPAKEIFLKLIKYISSKKIDKNKNKHKKAIKIINKIIETNGNYKEYRIDINGTDRNGNTLLGTAVLHEKFDIVKLLIEAGANVNQKDKDGFFPLKIAYSEGFTDIYQYLVQHGAHYPMDPPKSRSGL